jgi:predicted nucleic acid-binding protein
MAIVVDTSVLIDHLRGEMGACDARECLVASALAKVEILAGMGTGEKRVARRLLDSLDLIDVDDAVAERAGLLAPY